jgi:hypothetical protein
MEYILESLTHTLRKFAISHDETRFDDELGLIMKKMNTVDLEDTEENWKSFQKNYAKIRYLFEFINNSTINLTPLFYSSLQKFMETIDKQTQFYLQRILWDTQSNDESVIKNLFQDSLNENDPVKKLNSIVAAYTILVPIVEKIRNEKCNGDFETSFLDHFQPSAKRQKN